MSYPANKSSSKFRKVRAYALSDTETRSTCLVRVVRNSLFYISSAKCLTPLSWRNFLLDSYRDLESPIFDRLGNPVEIKLAWLECPEPTDHNVLCDLAIERAVRTYDDNLRSYFRETCCEPVRRNTKPVVHDVNRHRFIAIASIIGAAFPGISMHWPRHPIAGNDNDPMAMRRRG